jgi:LPXTG-motif cell wall-anchored protein
MDMILAGLALLALAVFLFWFNRRQLKRPRHRWDRFARTRQDKTGREPGARRFDRTRES